MRFPEIPRERLSEAITAELAHNRRPTGMQADEELVYDFCMALHEKHFVDVAQFPLPAGEKSPW